MNILAPAVATRKPLQFAVGTSIPYIYGAQDAASGEAFAPEMHFTHPNDKIQYALGFEGVRGISVASRQFTKSVKLVGRS